MVKLKLCLATLAFLGLSMGMNGQTIIASGSAGDSATYVLTDDSTLTISGSGKIKDSLCNDNTTIQLLMTKKLVINSGITSIGKDAFSNFKTYIGMYGMNNLVSVSIPSALTKIEERAFYFTIIDNFNASNVDTIEFAAFSSCYNLTSLNFNNLEYIGDYAFNR